jgi:HAD superfamily hydrolase (TIGR01549 family)
MIQAVLLDVDGTLVDNNPLHVLAWRRAFQRIGLQIAANDILHLVGMGGDQLVTALLGDDFDWATAERARAYHAEEYVGKKLIDHSEPCPGAIELLEGLRKRGVKIALASSAKEEELARYLKLLGGPGVVDVKVTKEKVSKTKPWPDIFARALEELGHPTRALVIGDTAHDVEAAQRAGLPCVTVLTGGIEREVLLRAGAAAIYDSAASIVEDLDALLRAGERRAA